MYTELLELKVQVKIMWHMTKSCELAGLQNVGPEMLVIFQLLRVNAYITCNMPRSFKTWTMV